MAGIFYFDNNGTEIKEYEGEPAFFLAGIFRWEDRPSRYMCEIFTPQYGENIPGLFVTWDCLDEEGGSVSIPRDLHVLLTGGLIDLWEDLEKNGGANPSESVKAWLCREVGKIAGMGALDPDKFSVDVEELAGVNDSRMEMWSLSFVDEEEGSTGYSTLPAQHEAIELDWRRGSRIEDLAKEEGALLD